MFLKKLMPVLLVLATAGGLWATALGDLAAQMTAGNWRELSTTNLGPTVSSNAGGATGSIFPYAQNGVWNPGDLSYYYLGSDHQHDQGYPKFIRYAASSGAWSEMTRPSWFPSLTATAMHAYDHNTIDPKNGVFYFARFCCPTSFYKYTISTSTWAQLPACGSLAYAYQNCGGFEYFPELNGVVFVSGAGGGEAYLYNIGTNSWSKIGTGLTMGDYHNFAEYNPVHHVMVLGGGNSSSALYKLDTLKKFTKLGNAPAEVGALRVNWNLFTVDPVSGDYLVFGGDGGSGVFYKYNVLTDTWTKINQTVPFLSTTANPNGGAVFLTIGAPVSSYGVNMFVKDDGGAGKVYVYKHSAGTAAEAPSPVKAGSPRISVSPNPFKSGAVIRVQGKLPAGATFRVYSADGRIVHAGKAADGVRCDGRRLAAGVYVFSLDLGVKTCQTRALLMR